VQASHYQIYIGYSHDGYGKNPGHQCQSSNLQIKTDFMSQFRAPGVHARSIARHAMALQKLLDSNVANFIIVYHVLMPIIGATNRISTVPNRCKFWQLRTFSIARASSESSTLGYFIT
jgi:hypothetical protein